jgi:broad specificity phosphatase PhoE
LTRIVLVRHGETEWNKAGIERFRGREDIELNETGVRQAKAAADRIASWPVLAFYSSPLKRALATARILASPFGLAVEPLEGLVDIDYGRWQGLSYEEASERYGQLYQQWLERPHEVVFPGGESLQDVRDRAAVALEKVLAQHQDETVVLVSHQVVCKVLLCALLGLDNSHFWQVEQDVCAINVLEARNGRLTVTLINDTCHLESLSF